MHCATQDVAPLGPSGAAKAGQHPVGLVRAPTYVVHSLANSASPSALQAVILHEVTALTAPIAELPETFRPLRREEFVALARMGAFGESRVELVGGVIVEMTPVRPPHSGVSMLLNTSLVQQAGDRLTVACQGPIELDPVSQPLPDFMVLPAGDYRRANPTHALLVIEIAESSLRFDLGEKARRYAWAGIPRYWVIDVVGRVVHVHTDPQSDGSWGSVRQVRSGHLVAEGLDLSIDLDELLDF